MVFVYLLPSVIRSQSHVFSNEVQIILFCLGFIGRFFWTLFLFIFFHDNRHAVFDVNNICFCYLTLIVCLVL